MRPIEHATLTGEVVCDPFMGTGTTCVAAKLLDRGYVGIELDARYFSIAASRIAATRREPSPRLVANDNCESSHRERPHRRPRRVRRLRREGQRAE